MMKAGVMLKTLGKVGTLEAGACFPLGTETAIDAPWWWWWGKEPSHAGGLLPCLHPYLLDSAVLSQEGSFYLNYHPTCQ